MNEWNEAVQAMIEWIEDNLTGEPVLQRISQHIGYSPYYCSIQFHKIVGMTLKTYTAGRRLCRAAIDIRDSNRRILDIAVQYGYSSQEALTRAFMSAFGCTPAAYRKNPRPIVFPIKQVVLLPEHYKHKGEHTMNQFCLKSPEIRVEYIPAHKYVGIWDDKATGYGDFWKYYDCDEVSGIVESMRNVSDLVVSCHTAGWHFKNGDRKYFYGLGVPLDYNGKIPDGFSIKEFPGSYYLVFFHPPFDYLKDNGMVMKSVEQLAWNYNIETAGLTDKHSGFVDTANKYQWNKDCQCYQRHYPEVLGYEVLRPFKKI